MPDYSELPSLIGKLKRAAIDAYMRTQPYPWDIEGDHYEISSSSTNTKVTRPGANGEGGGDWSSNNFIGEWLTGGSKDEEWSGAFDAIRTRIDDALEPFLDLPDPADIEPEVEKCRQVTRGLSGAAAASEGGQVGAGIIPGNLALVMQNSSAMSGASIGAFKSKFIGQLGAAIGGHHGISLVLGSALAAEKGIWEETRKDVTEIVEAARSACQEIADTQATVDWATVLKVTGWAVKGAGMFFPGAKPALEVAGLTITILEGTIPAEERVEVSASNAEAALGGFETALAKLRAQITAEEEALDQNLALNLGNIRNDQTSYDLSAPPIVSDAPNDAIAYTPGLIDEITQTYMPAISTELMTIGSTLLSVSWSTVARDPALGTGAQGPNGSWTELRYLLYELTRDLAWEVDKGAENLHLILQELLGLEDGLSQDLSGLQEELANGSPYDPWNEPAPAPPRGYPIPY